MNVSHIKGIIVIIVLRTQWQDMNFFQAPIMKILQSLQSSRMASYFVHNGAMKSEDIVTSKEEKYQESIEFSKSYRFVNKI